MSNITYNKSDLKDSIGNFRTLSLFYETNSTDQDPIFTLKDDDHTVKGRVLPSLKKIYLEFNDPTEWEFVQSVFGNWRHWERILNNQKLREYVDQWRSEMEIKLRSMAIKSIINHSFEKDSAAKWLAEAGWKPKKVGRPSKKELAREAHIKGQVDDSLLDHWDRVREEVSGNRKPN